MPREGGASSTHGLAVDGIDPVVSFSAHMGLGDYWIARFRGR